MKSLKIIFFAILSVMLSISCSDKSDPPEYTFPDPPKDNKDKPRFIWIDASANFNDFANNAENITRDLKLVKETGFTDIVVNVRTSDGDILFKSSVAGVNPVAWQAAWVNGVYTKVIRTATFDYLQEFITRGHDLGLRVHAGFVTMNGGEQSTLGSQGILFRDPSKKHWATSLNTLEGIKNVMDLGSSTKFLNPGNPEVQDYLVALLKDLAKYNLDGMFLDYGRYEGIQSDFSDISKKNFETYLGGETITKFPSDIVPVGATFTDVQNLQTYPKYFTKWIEFRAKTIYDFMYKARSAVKSVNPNIKFGVYVGGWYSSYYDVGVNWGSKKYNAENYFKWASSKYKEFGYAGLMDQILIGAYASPGSVYGSNEWSMQGFAKQAMDKIKKDCPMVAAGPDVGNWDWSDQFTQEQENQAITNSVKAIMDECDGYFLFDMIHLKLANQWQYAKQGIDLAIK